jgi:hypothetical protein
MPNLAVPGPTTAAKHDVPAKGTAATGSKMSWHSPRNVIFAKRERAPFASHLERLLAGPEYRSVVSQQLYSGVTLRDLVERGQERS